jgi:hypothetical protein
MVINKKSAHYRLYAWTYDAMDHGYAVPEHTNLCQYVQRMVWMTPVVLGYKLLVAIVYTILTPFVFLFGGRPTYADAIRYNQLYWESYPGLRVWGQVRLHPWVVALPALFFYLEYRWFHAVPWYYPTFIQLGVLLVIAAIIAYAWFEQSDTAALAKGWVSSKKSGICPVVEFTEEG